jgi:hypothetical protein
MAGILANSPSATMVAGDTAVDNTRVGYLVGEQVTLSVTPAGSIFSWGLAKPGGATVRSDLNATNLPSVVLVPDIEGFWTITATVDSTINYVLRLDIADQTPNSLTGALRFLERTGASIVVGPSGETMFFDSTLTRYRSKQSNGTIRDIDAGARTGSFTLSSGAVTVADTSVTANSVIAHMCTAAVNRGDLTFTLSAGVNFSVASTDGTDASTYRFAIIN